MEQERAAGCNRLIRNAIICWNYLYLSQLLVEEPMRSEIGAPRRVPEWFDRPLAL
jgi:hypothetical protein